MLNHASASRCEVCGTSLAAPSAPPPASNPAAAGTVASLPRGAPSLFDAITAKQPELLSRLLAAKASTNVRNADSLTPLLLACNQGDASAVKALLAANASVSDCDSLHGGSVLHWTAAGPIATLLIQARASINAQDKEGSTALIVASKAGNQQLVQALLQHNANTNVQNQAGFAAIHVAAGQGHTAIVKMLLESKVDANLKTKQGSGAVDLAADNRMNETVQLLLASKAMPARALGSAQPAAQAAAAAPVALRLMTDPFKMQPADVSVYLSQLCARFGLHPGYSLPAALLARDAQLVNFLLLRQSDRIKVPRPPGLNMVCCELKQF